eukprot:TRINITY_DN5320_c0_g3_i1.p1 TRINITY_DN5320_c0_g3~~TRINITY_DN5320_c0_g3_i1.p1  ORF type:complete len:463 (-),score=215.22 TRINITY_DN5320_c0_g3_i1:406-1794(-)
MSSSRPVAVSSSAAVRDFEQAVKDVRDAVDAITVGPAGIQQIEAVLHVATQTLLATSAAVRTIAGRRIADAAALSDSDDDDGDREPSFRPRVSGDVFVFGRGEFGRLGLGDNTENQLIPQVLLTVGGLRPVDLAGGAEHSLLLTDSGDVYAFGRGNYGQLGFENIASTNNTPQVVSALKGKRAIQIATHSEHSLVLMDNGEVYAFGYGASGQLGLGEKAVFKTRPQLVQGPLAGKRVTAVTCGAEHSLVLTEAGEVYAFGSGGSGRLGFDGPDVESEPLPRLITALVGKRIVAISAGDFHSLVLTSDGKVYTFGCNDSGQLGLGDSSNRRQPTLVEALAAEKVTAIAAGFRHSLVLTATGRVYAFGSGDGGRLGLGSDTSNRKTPTLVDGVPNATAIAAGAEHSLVANDKGEVYAFGRGRHGQLGLGSKEDCNVPRLIHALSGRKAVVIGAGDFHSLILASA